MEEKNIHPSDLLASYFLEQLRPIFVECLEQLTIAREAISSLETEYQQIVADAAACNPARQERKEALIGRISTYLNVDNNRYKLDIALSKLETEEEKLHQVAQFAREQAFILPSKWVKAIGQFQDLISKIRIYNGYLELPIEKISGIGAERLKALKDYLLFGEGDQEPNLEELQKRAADLREAHTQDQKKIFLKQIEETKDRLEEILRSKPGS